MDNTRYVIIACYPDKGMKSCGSKSLLYFHNKRLIEHQIHSLKKDKKTNITIVAEFDFHRLQKTAKDIDPTIDIILLQHNNPINLCCTKYPNENLCFIDYGCIFNKKIIHQLTFETSEVICIHDAANNNNLDVGCITNRGYIEHMFFDLPKNKFCNIFGINSDDAKIIACKPEFKKTNLLYFEIINLLIYYNCIVKPVFIANHFIFFNHMRQKHAINRFIKKNN